MDKHLRFYYSCIVVTISLPGLISCTKNLDHWNIPDEFQSWCRYREGTYWIYRNEKTQQNDCTYVTGYSLNSLPHSQDPTDYYIDWERSEITGAFLTGIYGYTPGKDVAGMTIYGNTNARSLYFSLAQVTNPEFIKAVRTGQEGMGVVAVYPTEKVNGNSFTNVYNCVTEYVSSAGDSVITSGHLVKNTGLVKYIKHRANWDTTWTLLRWHVVQ